ncbi:MAG: serine/threonine-protein kinase [Gemmatimonadales bacterium]
MTDAFGDLAPGMLLADRFDVETVLGRGGCATVYRAHDRVLDRPVAVKLLNAEASSSVDAARFDREIRLTARLVHPGIVPLFDSGVASTRRFYVMPCIVGETLRQLIELEHTRELGQIVRVCGDVAEALSYAHSRGVVHRDIKPENIFLSDGRAIVADFGIARPLDVTRHTSAVTEMGLAIGTVAYMSPEQALGESGIDGRTDLYALGCMMVELLTGTPPFVGSSSMAVLSQHITAAPKLDERLAGNPARLQSLIARLLAKSPEERPASAAIVVEELRNIGAQLSAPRAAATTSSVPAVAPDARRAPAVVTESERLTHQASDLFNRAVQGGAGTRGVLDIALVYAERAAALDESNAHALTVLSDVVHVRGFRGFDDEELAFARATQLRLKALSIDDNIGELHASLGVTALYWEDDFERAGTHLRRAVELAPHDAKAHRHYGCWLKMRGEFDEALAQVRAAEALAPEASHVKIAVADILMSLGRYVEAIVPLQAALRAMPNYEQATERLEMACHRSGRFEDAFAARRTMLGTHRLYDRLAKLAEVFESDGWEATREQDLRVELAQLLERTTTEDPFKDPQGSRQLSDRLIIAYGELGEWHEAMDWVERGYYLRPGRLIRVLTDLPFDRRGLAVDRRYARLLRTAGLDALL